MHNRQVYHVYMLPYKNAHDPLNFNMVDGVKIFTGTTQYSQSNLDVNIDYYKKLVDGRKIFTELVPSTLTAKGAFNGVIFNEEEIIDMLSIPNGGYIIQIGCNYGVLKNPNPLYTAPAVKTRVSKRGRKPKTKPKTKRKLQGSGKFFSSQITFEIYNPDNKKVYKIKLFRNGGFQVPGIKRPDMKDLIKPIRILRDYLRDEFVDESIEVQYFISVMRNYICKLRDENLLIRINDLENLFKTQKESTTINPICNYVDKLPDSVVESIKSLMKDYIGKKVNMIGIAEIQNNCERYFGLILKFYRPVPWKLTKRTTIKVLRSGKINIDGSNSIEESYELYHWMASVMLDHPELFYDLTTIANAADSDSYEIDSDCGSIYDEDLPAESIANDNINDDIANAPA